MQAVGRTSPWSWRRKAACGRLLRECVRPRSPGRGGSVRYFFSVCRWASSCATARTTIFSMVCCRLLADLVGQAGHRVLQRFLHAVAQALLEHEVDPALQLLQDALGQAPFQQLPFRFGPVVDRAFASSRGLGLRRLRRLGASGAAGASALAGWSWKTSVNTGMLASNDGFWLMTCLRRSGSMDRIAACRRRSACGPRRHRLRRWK